MNKRNQYHTITTLTVWVDSNNKTFNYYRNIDSIISCPLDEVRVVDCGDKLEFFRRSYKIIYKSDKNSLIRLKLKLRLNGVKV